MQEFVEQFNKFFGDAAKAELVRGRLEITIGTLTAAIEPSIPRITGGSCQPGESTS